MKLIITVLVATFLIILGLMYMAIEGILEDILNELKKQNRLLRNLNNKGE